MAQMRAIWHCEIFDTTLDYLAVMVVVAVASVVPDKLEQRDQRGQSEPGYQYHKCAADVGDT